MNPIRPNFITRNCLRPLQSAKLKNQFRSLDDDEIDFLDSVLESTRAREQAVKRETAEQLAAFRKHQEEVERKALSSMNEDTGLVPESPVVEGEELWSAVGRKRKRGKDKEGFRGLKLKRTSSAHEQTALGESEEHKEEEKPLKTSGRAEKETKPHQTSSKASGKEGKQAAPAATGLLAGYSSDEDD